MIAEQLQTAIFAALQASPALATLCGPDLDTAGQQRRPVRVYDRAPADAAYSMITVGDEQVLDESHQCGDAWEVYADVHVWSRAVGRVEAKTIAAAVRDALATELIVPGFIVVEGRHVSTRSAGTGDPLTTRLVLTFRFLIDPA